MSFAKANAAMSRSRRAKKASATDAVEASLDAHDEQSRGARVTTISWPGATTLRDLRVDAVITQVSLGHLVRHPANRVPTQADIDARAESIEAHGLLDPITVRRLGDGRLQVLSGETRWRAAAKLGWNSIAAREALDCSDSAALQLLAVANAQRRDLTVAQKALLIKRLSDPVEEGGAGLTRAAAGATYGLSASAASNLVRLLDAPAEWLERIDHPERPVHQATVREIAKCAGLPDVLAALEDKWSEWIDDDSAYAPLSRDEQLWEVRDCVRQATRPVEPQDYVFLSDLGRVDGGDVVRGLTAEQLEYLAIRELPAAHDGSMSRRATNCGGWDALARKRAGERKAKKLGGPTEASDDASPAPAKSAKQLAAEQREKRKEQDEQLADWIAREWRPLMLRLAIAEAMTSEVASMMVPWLLSSVHFPWRLPSWQYLAAASDKSPERRDDVLADLRSRAYAVSRTDRDALLLRLAKLIVWPAGGRADTPFADLIPSDPPALEFDELDAWAGHLNVSIHTAWDDGTVDDSSERHMVRWFFERHTSPQLRDLANDHYTAAARLAAIDLPDKKSGMVEALLAAHRPGSPLRLPASLRDDDDEPKKRKGGRRG